ncbi:histone-like nucleoid-structuring protein Lsr2 [Streptomyces sp. NPDC001508]|uniref:Lsr2 family DNA-binding protein n=1 Tax=Streptomyces sp. NPDC001508 TaxID=3154656 RepID=UPI00332C7FD3
MRKTVLVPVEYTFCDAHIARDGSEVEATSSLTLGKDTWHLCLEHDVTFGRYLCGALGAPSGEVITETQAESVPIVEAVLEPEPEAATDPEPVPSVMIAGEVPGYDWEDAREAVRNLGYEVVGRADESTVLLILGEGGDRNGTKLRDASERGIPVMDARKPGRFKSAILSAELIGGDPLPEPAKVDRSGMSERERNAVIRSWARTNGFTVPAKGRIPMNVRHSYEMAHKEASEGKAAAA